MYPAVPRRDSLGSLCQSGTEILRGRGRNIRQVREKQKLRDSFPTTRASLPLSPIHSRGLSCPLCPSFIHSPLSSPRVTSPSHPQSTLTRNKSIHVSADYLAECSRPVESLQPNLWGWRRYDPKENSLFWYRPFAVELPSRGGRGNISFYSFFLFIRKQAGRELAS